MTRTVFRGGEVFDGTGSPATAADVLVENDRIIAVGGDLDGDVAVDCTGKTLLPGLFDTHVHVMFSGFGPISLLSKPFSYQFYEAAANLKKTLAVGITTVRDAGGADLGVKRAVANGLIPGPRMRISVSVISQTGGHGDGRDAYGNCAPYTAPYPGRPEGLADGPDAMRKLAREIIKAGADQLKVCTTGGVLSPHDDPRHAHFTPEELAVLTTEAAMQGTYVMAHAQGTEGIKNAIRAGIRSIEHGIYLDDEAIEMMVAAGTWLVPTLVVPVHVLRAVDAGIDIPEPALRKTKEIVEIHADSVSRAIAAGVKVAMGSDSGAGPHGTNLDELPLMVGCGMTPAQSLAATTSNSAQLLRLGDELGRIAEGYRADLVLVDGGIDDLTGLATRIGEVWQDGRKVSTD